VTLPFPQKLFERVSTVSNSIAGAQLFVPLHRRVRISEKSLSVQSPKAHFYRISSLVKIPWVPMKFFENGTPVSFPIAEVLIMSDKILLFQTAGAQKQGTDRRFVNTLVGEEDCAVLILWDHMNFSEKAMPVQSQIAQAHRLSEVDLQVHIPMNQKRWEFLSRDLEIQIPSEALWDAAVRIRISRMDMQIQFPKREGRRGMPVLVPMR
jgi:hypothetical protein